MTTAPVRLVALLSLSGYLLPLGFPLVCHAAMNDAAAGCEQAAPRSDRPAVATATHDAACANPVLCAVTPTAIAADLVLAFAPSDVHRMPSPVASPVNPGEPVPPLSPPPQA